MKFFIDFLPLVFGSACPRVIPRPRMAWGAGYPPDGCLGSPNWGAFRYSCIRIPDMWIRVFLRIRLQEAKYLECFCRILSTHFIFHSLNFFILFFNNFKKTFLEEKSVKNIFCKFCYYYCKVVNIYYTTLYYCNYNISVTTTARL